MLKRKKSEELYLSKKKIKLNLTLLPELWLMVFKELTLKESLNSVFICKLWSSCIFKIHEREIGFLKLFNLSILETTCHLSFDLFKKLFIEYIRYVYFKSFSSLKTADASIKGFVRFPPFSLGGIGLQLQQ